MKLSKSRIVGSLIGACLLGSVALAHAQAADVSKQLADHKAASQELVRLFGAVKDDASAKALAAQIDAATKKQRAAEDSISAVLGKLDPKKDRPAMEKAITELQASNKAAADAYLRAADAQAAAKAKAAAPAPAATPAATPAAKK